MDFMRSTNHKLLSQIKGTSIYKLNYLKFVLPLGTTI
jgi:hypothetical protein